MNNMHSEYNLTMSCVRLFITISTYLLLYKPCIDGDFMSFLITALIYVFGQWINILDVIEHNETSSRIEIVGVVLGVLIISSVIFLLALNGNNSLIELSSLAILISSAIFCIIDSMSLAKVLKKLWLKKQNK